MRRVVVVAVAYFILGRLSLLLSLPSGYGTAVWPAAGLALGAVLVWGPRCAIGVAIGSFVVHVSIPTDTSDPVAIARTIGIAFGIGSGAALQAIAGRALVLRYVGAPLTLTRERDVFRFILVAAPVACFVSATVGVSLLFATGVLATSEVPYSWWTWWVGDVIGVVLLAPCMLIAFAMPREVWRARAKPLGIPLVACGAIVIASFAYASAQDEVTAKHEFQQRTGRLADAIRAELATSIETIEGVRMFFEASRDIDRAMFHRLVVESTARHRGFRAIGWAPLVLDHDRASFESFAGFPITDRRSGASPHRDEYFPLLFTEPLDASNKPILGYDVFSEPMRREAIEHARTSGGLVITHPIDLIAEPGKRGVLVLAPIGRGPTFRGVALGILRIPDLIHTALLRHDQDGIDLEIADVGGDKSPAGDRSSRLATLRGGEVTSLDIAIGMNVDETVTTGGRTWRLRFAPSPEFAFIHRSWRAWVVLAIGLLFTTLLGAFLLVVTGRSYAVALLVEHQTQSLAQNVKEKEVMIREIHHRVKNNLQVISSLINMQVRELDDVARERGALRDCQRRVEAIALVHERLYQTNDFASVSFASYARSLAANVFEAMGVSTDNVTLVVDIAEVDLTVERAIPCGLILNELLSNALKHAFPDSRGTIYVELRMEDASTAVLLVRDDGRGMPPEHPKAAKSLGLRLVGTLARQLQGTVEVTNGTGVATTVTFPIGAT